MAVSSFIVSINRAIRRSKRKVYTFIECPGIVMFGPFAED